MKVPTIQLTPAESRRADRAEFRSALQKKKVFIIVIIPRSVPYLGLLRQSVVQLSPWNKTVWARDIAVYSWTIAAMSRKCDDASPSENGHLSEFMDFWHLNMALRSIVKRSHKGTETFARLVDVTWWPTTDPHIRGACYNHAAIIMHHDCSLWYWQQD